MAVIADPTGAVFGVWQARDSIGATLVNDPGCLTMNELSTNDADAAATFYSDLFGWKVEALDTQGAPPYWSIRHEGGAGGLNGGMRELAPEQSEAGVPPHWMPYFTVASLDEAIATTQGAGGTLHAGPIEIPAGRIAVLSDPQGAFFAIFEGEMADRACPRTSAGPARRDGRSDAISGTAGPAVRARKSASASRPESVRPGGAARRA